MKKFNELTNIEICNLTPEQVLTYKKIELAENGIVFPVKPQEPVLAAEEKPDMVIYTIPVIGGRLAFTDEEDARNVLNALRQAKSAGLADEYGIPRFSLGYGKDYNGQTRILAVEPKECYSADVYARNTKIRESNSKLTSDYKEARKQYDELMTKVEEQLKDINKRITDAHDNIWHKQRLTTYFVRDYLPIAEGNTETAMRFLKLAHPVSESDEAYILEHYNDTQE